VVATSAQSDWICAAFLWVRFSSCVILVCTVLWLLRGGAGTMPNFKLQIPNAHFHKHWHDSAAHKGRIVTWHNQAARKHRRRENRLAKAIKNFPRPVNGLVRPVVHCQTIRYNMKKRAGKGFTLEELKAAKVNRREARGIGISVDFRRKNRSEQSLRENVARLEQYKANLIVFPKKSNRKTPQKTDSSKDACSKAEQLIGDVMPIVKPKPTIVPYKITQVPCCPPLLIALSLARASVTIKANGQRRAFSRRRGGRVVSNTDLVRCAAGGLHGQGQEERQARERVLRQKRVLHPAHCASRRQTYWKARGCCQEEGCRGGRKGEGGSCLKLCFQHILCINWFLGVVLACVCDGAQRLAPWHHFPFPPFPSPSFPHFHPVSHSKTVDGM
jgi:large subunit ribosomal protein L13e